MTTIFIDISTKNETFLIFFGRIKSKPKNSCFPVDFRNIFSYYLLEFDLTDDLKKEDIVIRRTMLANANMLSEIINCIVNGQE